MRFTVLTENLKNTLQLVKPATGNKQIPITQNVKFTFLDTALKLTTFDLTKMISCDLDLLEVETDAGDEEFLLPFDLLLNITTSIKAEVIEFTLKTPTKFLVKAD